MFKTLWFCLNFIMLLTTKAFSTITMKELLKISVLFFLFKCVLNKVQYSDSFIAFYDGPVDEQNFNLLKEYGYVLDTQINIGQGFYRFVRKEGRTRVATKIEIDQDEIRRKDPKAASHTPSMGVYNVWDSGFTGKGVTVAIVDDGIETSHSDLAANYKASLSIDIVFNVANPSHRYSTDGHGTNCAGIVAAVKNTNCIIGTAYEASIPAIRLLDSVLGATDSEEASALVHQLAHIDIYSNSWGPSDNGKDYNSALASVQQAALVQGVTNGRGGKGVIYIWAAGNGGANFDDCNFDGYANSMYTIAVTSLAPDASAAWYTEECTSVMVATYGGDDRQNRLATTDRINTCIDDFQGTSASAPVASGIIALVLQANPNLTWRDIQHMIVEYSTNTGLNNANFYTNGAGKKVSLSHGFGLMNAERMVTAASSWQTVPSRISCEGSTSSVYKYKAGLGTITATKTLSGCCIKRLEHILVKISFRSLYRELTSIFIVSPAGTTSRLLRERYKDSETSTVIWTFMSVHTWGENPAGTWTLRMQSSHSRNEMYLNTWKLDLYGTATNPIADGSLGGYCDGSIACISSTHVCNTTTHRCASCNAGYHGINGVCIQYGVLGGFCNSNTACVDAGSGCERTSLTCISCGVGYRVINNFCEQDGALGGFCDNSTSCTNTDYSCENTICMAATGYEDSDEKEDSSSTSSSDVNIGAIVGGVIGALVVIIGALIVVVKLKIGATPTVAPAPALSGARAPI